MNAEVLAALIGGIGGLVSGAIAALATLRAKRVDQLVETAKLWVGSYETKLLEQRLVEYKKLWRLTQPTSRRRVAGLDSDGAQMLADRLTEWYYDDGGIVLSEDSRAAFFAARNALDGADGPDDDWRNEIISRFSHLRTALCEDMNSRRGPMLRSAEEMG